MNFLGDTSDSAPAGRPACGRTISGVTMTNNSELFFCRLRERNNRPKNGMSPSPGILLSCSVTRLSSKSADGEALSGFQFDLGLHAARGESGNGGALERQAVREIERAYFGRHLQPDGSARRNGGREIDAHAELAKLNGNRAQPAAAALQRGKWEFAARQKTGGVIVQRQDVRLGQDLQPVLRLQRFNGRAQIQIGPEEENIQSVRQAEGGLAGRAGDAIAAATPNCSTAAEAE